jgi:hypothetical protein
MRLIMTTSIGKTNWAPDQPLRRLVRAGLRRVAERARRWREDSLALRDIEGLLASEDHLLRDTGLDRSTLHAEAFRIRQRRASLREGRRQS